jgi:hypothetical protein
MVVAFAWCRRFNLQPEKKMPTKKKTPATKHKVELKDLRPKKDAKGGAQTIVIRASPGDCGVSHI